MQSAQGGEPGQSAPPSWPAPQVALPASSSWRVQPGLVSHAPDAATIGASQEVHYMPVLVRLNPTTQLEQQASAGPGNGQGGLTMSGEPSSTLAPSQHLVQQLNGGTQHHQAAQAASGLLAAAQHRQQQQLLGSAGGLGATMSTLPWPQIGSGSCTSNSGNALMCSTAPAGLMRSTAAAAAFYSGDATIASQSQVLSGTAHAPIPVITEQAALFSSWDEVVSNMQPDTTQTHSVPGMTASLYVKNLPNDATELFLYQRFAPYGALLSCRVHTDPTTGKCKGVGFVNFRDQQAALHALQSLHGTRLPTGHKLHITLQAPRAVRGLSVTTAVMNPSAGIVHPLGTTVMITQQTPGMQPLGMQ